MRAGCQLQWDIMRAKEEGRLPEGEEDEEELTEEQKRMWDELVVLERFKEHVGPSLQSLSVRPFPPFSFLLYLPPFVGTAHLHLRSLTSSNLLRPPQHREREGNSR
jgi:hypothetical protein